MQSLCRTAVRAMSTARPSSTYPFSKTALIPPPPPVAPSKPLREGKGLMQYLHKSLPTPEKQELLRSLFSRSSPTRLFPGSILTVTLEHAPTTFTGVLLAIRRRGPDTSFVLRNIIQRTGVEMQFFANSPHVKDIKRFAREDEHDSRWQEVVLCFYPATSSPGISWMLDLLSPHSAISIFVSGQ
ncbi:54S ribosomal protein subunit img1, mitochondrial [Hypsizygus marmoreus]|uniref:54S ribosomal protein subunit img1, mitochondrial n=1 Tax=Hypsizygus marmoreus TaxID=39966 RepID=A0A369JWX2_HYPMA|nr:54S ribosomal protein subunit img1, mitochondrial [Hypsizygus marmoreus]